MQHLGKFLLMFGPMIVNGPLEALLTLLSRDSKKRRGCRGKIRAYIPMALLETLTINLGASILKTTAKVWLKDAPVAEGAVGGFADTFKKLIEDFETRRATERLFDSLQDEIARRLKPAIDASFPRLAENERIAAALAVADVFKQLDLTEAVASVDLEASRLEGLTRPIAEREFALLSDDGMKLAAMLLTESCNYVVTLAGKMPNFQVAATRELLKRHSELHAERCGIEARSHLGTSAASHNGQGPAFVPANRSLARSRTFGLASCSA